MAARAARAGQTRRPTRLCCTMTHLRVADDERRVAGHEEMAPGSRDEGGHQPDQVVVHVAGITQGCCRRRHDSAHDRVQLADGRVRDPEAVHLQGKQAKRLDRPRLEQTSAESFEGNPSHVIPEAAWGSEPALPSSRLIRTALSSWSDSWSDSESRVAVGRAIP